MKRYSHAGWIIYCAAFFFFSCNNGTTTPSPDLVRSVDLKRGNIVACGPQDGQFGEISFSASLPDTLRHDFNIAVAQLHSFEYDEAEKMFTKIIDRAPDCAMAWWGVAMSNFHPLWAPPSGAELEKGAKAVEIARSVGKKTERESEYIEAIGSFFAHADKLDHHNRVLIFEKEMEKIYDAYPDDKEAAVFYSLALNAAADPADKTYTRQKKAFGILNRMFEQEPLHPGIAHYIIHNFDYPGLAEMALPAARKYASIAPASAHAQHMPSHIFTRLGLWDECIRSNLVAASSGRCYAENTGLRGYWDEELHAMDYLVYAYLQKGEDELAGEKLDILQKISQVDPLNFKVMYAFAAIPSRYYLEKRIWDKAANLTFYPAHFPWDKFPWQKAIIHFTRALGLVHIGNIEFAKIELDTLKDLQSRLNKVKNMEKETSQVGVQILSTEAWIRFREGDHELATRLMTRAADMEDASEKHPVTPGEILPARELLGDLYLEMNKPAMALNAYAAVLKTHPNRFNALYSAGLAAEQNGDKELAKQYFRQLLKSIGGSASKRKELEKVRAVLRNR